MFPLFHDRTRRQICRVLFLLFGILPTGAVIAWSAVVNGTGYRTAACKTISAALGSDVRAVSVYHPREEITVLKGFDLFDPETGAVWFHSPHIQVLARETGQTIELERPELSAKGHNWWLPIVQRCLRLGERPLAPLHLHASEVTLVSPSGTQMVRNLTIDISSSAEGNEAVAKFEWGDGVTTDPVELRFRRFNEHGRPVSWIELNTGTAAVPCSLLTAALQPSDWFGKSSTFCGKLQLREGPQGWIAEVTDGRLGQVDLQKLVQHHYAGECQGTARVSLQHAMFRDGQVVEIHGTIEAGAGTVSKAVLDALRYSLILRQPANWANMPASLAFEQCAAEFSLTGDTLTIVGKCDSSQTGVVLRGTDQPLLSDPGTPLCPWWRW